MHKIENRKMIGENPKAVFIRLNNTNKHLAI